MKSKKKLRKFLKSMRFRLVIVFIFFGMLPGIVLSTGLVRGYENRAISIRCIDILNQAKILSDQIANTGYLEDVTLESINSRVELICNIYDGRVLVIDNTFHIIKDTYDLDTRKIIICEEVATSFQGSESNKYDPVNRYIQLTLPICDVDTQETLGVLLVSASTDVVRDAAANLKNIAVIVLLFAGFLITIFAVFVAGRFTWPFRKMSKSIEDIQIGYGEGLLLIDD